MTSPVPLHPARSYSRLILIAIVMLMAPPTLLSSDDALPHQLPLIEPKRHMVKETRHVVQAIERLHYLNKPIARIDFAKLIRDYMTDLDYSRLFFLQSDEGDFQRFNNTMHFYLISGNLHPAFEIYKVYRERALHRIEWTLERLKTPFDFTTTDTYTPDRSEAAWPVDVQSANRLWDFRLQYEVLNELFIQHQQSDDGLTEAEPDKPTQTLGSSHGASPLGTEGLVQRLTQLHTNDHERFEAILDKARETLENRYQRWKRNIYETEATDVQEIFLNTLTHTYDPHSGFLSADSLEDFNIAMRNSLVGIGAILSDEEGYCTIKELIPGGPASLSQKLKPNDKIVGVAQSTDGDMVDVIDMKLRKIVKQIRGKKGTTVRLLIQPTATVDPSIREEISLVRDEIKLTANLATADLIEVPRKEKNVPIGVIQLPSFYGSSQDAAATTEDVEELVNKLKALGIHGLILDLRHNGGGLLSEAISLTGLFIPEGPIVQVRDATGNVIKKFDKDPKIIWHGPLSVLISRHSASASEIVAGALQTHRRALIIGDTTTHGKGTVQSIFEMNHSLINRIAHTRPSGAAKITIQKFYLPNGNSTQKKGVVADISIPSINELLPISESDLPNALPWDSIAPLPVEETRSFTWTHNPLDTDILHELRKQSLYRQETLEEFHYLQRYIQWFKDKQEQKTFSLNLEHRETQKLADREHQEHMDSILNQLTKNQFEKQRILLDITLEQKDKTQHNETAETPFPNRSEKALTAQNDETSATAPSATAAEETKEKTIFDIPLRESLRVLSDWIHYYPVDKQGAPPVADNLQREAA